MILIQDLLGALHIHIVVAGFAPRQLNQPFEIRPAHRIFRRGRRDFLQAIDLLLRNLPGLFRHLRLFDFLANLFDFQRLIVFAQFFLYGFQLLPEVIFALGFGNLSLDFRLNFFTEFQPLDLTVDKHCRLFQTLMHIQFLKNPLFFRISDIQVTNRPVNQARRMLDIGEHAHVLLRQVRRHLNQFTVNISEIGLQRIDFDIFFVIIFIHTLEYSAKIRLFLCPVGDLHPVDTLDYGAFASVRHVEDLQHLCHRSEGV
ncbi:MAG: hypothetical protein MAGBODY4_00957 [Candidatus Marinimicrobia bacterium]|nr:hypothetical protein [Candidatus Neomarinimicrobiota bacterium]